MKLSPRVRCFGLFFGQVETPVWPARARCLKRLRGHLKPDRGTGARNGGRDPTTGHSKKKPWPSWARTQQLYQVMGALHRAPDGYSRAELCRAFGVDAQRKPDSPTFVCFASFCSNPLLTFCNLLILFRMRSRSSEIKLRSSGFFGVRDSPHNRLAPVRSGDCSGRRRRCQWQNYRKVYCPYRQRQRKPLRRGPHRSGLDIPR